ncbi:ParB/RepB/Spo0J family partition protein [Aurantimonas endophytica]|uniref:ParB family chromosome partitioning protein n=1 Tax=Aurantimonas endophytica TaxID=1522175 RepID=A0A7W6MRI8_9HYPH|nr:ParB/RepB/Spo0J family partition protein [Aurantimonas endophytica]MBB4005090.1 ParB family chromosome partitioning protein [Aurantimonas endophytica]MCO6406245.1 ParB/RepB/Spo0J family partition protein [Aurantimonas endophytica]
MTENRSRQRLGRGLASLIGTGVAAPSRAVPGFAADEPAIPAERHVAIDRLSANPNNPRRRFDDGELKDLAASIRNHGVVQPLLVRPTPGVSDRFEIVAGERRWRAARLAGLSEVPVVLRDIGDRQSLEIAIIENVQRSDLNAVEEAQAYEQLISEHGYTQSDLADVLGKSRSHVANTLRLLKLPDEVRDMVVSGTLSAGAARTVVTAEDPLAVAREIVSRGLSVREAEDLARGPAAEPAAKPSKPRRNASVPAKSEKDEDAQALERLLSETLGMAVEIEVDGEGGSVRIAYADLEQLDALCGLLQAHARSRLQGGEPRLRSL